MTTDELKKTLSENGIKLSLEKVGGYETQDFNQTAKCCKMKHFVQNDTASVLF